ncbi:MAG: tyrosine-type recombinase/integrase [Emcibacter sp.]|nr:tyrosine-type recombinase/integrase [Emcibacter sp.]
MAKVKLTDPLIRKTKSPEKGYSELGDTIVKGLILRITVKNTRSWDLRYSTKGKQWRFNIGGYPALSLSKARKEARRLLGEISLGSNPQAEKNIERQNMPEMVKEAVARFIETYARPKNRESSVTQAEWALGKHLIPKIGNCLVKDVTKADIICLIDRLAAKPRSGVNLIFRHWRRFFNWAVEKDIIPHSPMAGIKQPLKEKSRDRVLSDPEIRLVWQAIEKQPYPMNAFYKLLFLTGQRRCEVATLKWSHIENGIWTIPADIAKNGRVHDIPLSGMALEILDSIPHQKSAYLFTSTAGRTNDKGEDLSSPISGFSKAKRRLDAEVAKEREKHGMEEIAPWRVHDIRRTVATQLAKMGFPIHVVEKILNHSSGTISGVAAVYNRHDYADEKKAALDAWDRRLREIMAGKKYPENIVQLHG